MKSLCFSASILIALMQYVRIAGARGHSPKTLSKDVKRHLPNANCVLRSHNKKSIFAEGYTTMPNLFVHEKNADSLNRFAACIAATEGLRLVRDIDLSNHSTRSSSREVKKIESQFLKDSKQVLTNFGMTEKEYKSIESLVLSNESLLRKVREQAILYRIDAAVTMDQPPKSTISRSLPTQSIDPKPSGGVERNREILLKFRRSLIDIEILRQKQLQQLLRTLNLNKLPDYVDITDERVLPLLSPKVRAVVKAFAFQAEEVVQRNGLAIDDFNSMLRNSKQNPLFRLRLRQLQDG